jgi:predicted deacylase
MSSPEKRTKHLSVPTGTGDEVHIPLATATGSGEGPHLLVVAGVHGSEYVGIEATSRFFRWIDETKLSGTVVVVPCLNVPAFYGLAMHVNPLDGKNLGSVFPGDSDGTATDRIARAVFDELVASADFVVDVHGGDLEEELVEYSQINLTGDAAVDIAAESLARALDMPMFLRSPKPDTPPRQGNLFEMAAVEGRPAVLVEAGSHGVLDEQVISVHFKALRNALHHLEMLPGEPAVTNPQPLELHRFLGVEAPVEGAWYPRVVKGEIVREGQTIGEMRDFFGTRLAVLSSPEDAAILGVMTIPPRRQGDWVMGLGTLS